MSTASLDTLPRELVVMITEYLPPRTSLQVRVLCRFLETSTQDMFTQAFLQDIEWDLTRPRIRQRIDALVDRPAFAAGVERVCIVVSQPLLAENVSFNKDTKRFEGAPNCGYRELKRIQVREIVGALGKLVNLQDLYIEKLRVKQDLELMQAIANLPAFPALEALVLHSLECVDANDLANLIWKHRATLRDINLSHVHVNFGSWQHILNAIRTVNNDCSLYIISPWQKSGPYQSVKTRQAGPGDYPGLWRVSFTPDPADPNAHLIQVIRGIVMWHGRFPVKHPQYVVQSGNLHRAVDCMNRNFHECTGLDMENHLLYDWVDPHAFPDRTWIPLTWRELM